jgi:hypothetical protein
MLAILKGAATVLATGVMTGGVLLEQGATLRTAVTAGVVAVAAQTLAQLVPAGAASAIASSRTTPTKPLA